MEFSSLDSLIEHERKKFDNLNALIDSEATAFKIEDPVQHEKVKSADLTSRMASTTPVQTPEFEANYGRDELPAPLVQTPKVDDPAIAGMPPVAAPLTPLMNSSPMPVGWR